MSYYKDGQLRQYMDDVVNSPCLTSIIKMHIANFDDMAKSKVAFIAKSEEVRVYATKLIAPEYLPNIIRERGQAKSVLIAGISRLEGENKFLVGVILATKDMDIACSCAEKINSEYEVYNLICNPSLEEGIKEILVLELKDQSHLQEIASNNENGYGLRSLAISKIQSFEFLKKLLLESENENEDIALCILNTNLCDDETLQTLKDRDGRLGKVARNQIKRRKKKGNKKC